MHRQSWLDFPNLHLFFTHFGTAYTVVVRQTFHVSKKLVPLPRFCSQNFSMSRLFQRREYLRYQAGPLPTEDLQLRLALYLPLLLSSATTIIAEELFSFMQRS